MKKPLNIISLLLLAIIFSCNPNDISEHSSGLFTPESQGISSKAIISFIEAAEAERPDDMHSIIIMRHGKKIAEGYWAPYNANKRPASYEHRT